MNVFYDVIAPEIRTPRDLLRLKNALAVTWAAVGSEVDRADFVALETLRLLRGDVYRALRASKEVICGLADRGGGDGRGQAGEMDTLLLGSVKENDRPRLRRALMRLFPRLERARLQGWRVMPVSGLSPTGLHPNSLVVVLPMRMAPALRARSTAGASTVATLLTNAREPDA